MAQAKQSQSYKKTIRYLAEIAKSEPFQNAIKEIREKYNIKVGEKKLNFNGFEEFDGLQQDIAEKLGSKFNLDSYTTRTIFILLTHALDFTPENFSEQEFPKGNLLCKMLDILNLEYVRMPKFYRPMEAYAMPVGITISPYASKRDILDFVEKEYKTKIKPMQDKYKNNPSLINKLRDKDPLIQKRNNFIFEHRNLRHDRIRQLVVKEFRSALPEKKYILDVGAIGKIISMENKKRKDM